MMRACGHDMHATCLVGAASLLARGRRVDGTPLPLVAASEAVGILGAVAGAPTVYWFWSGIDSTVLMDRLPANHSPEFAPAIEPTLTTGVETLVVAALTWFETVLCPPCGRQPDAMADRRGRKGTGTVRDCV